MKFRIPRGKTDVAEKVFQILFCANSDEIVKVPEAGS